MNSENPGVIIPVDEAFGRIEIAGSEGPSITVIGTQSIRDGFDEPCLRQAINSRTAPGVSDLVLNPDGHAGYGAPVGCVLVSPSHIYPGPVGVDIKCSMSFLQLDVPQDAVVDKRVRRALIEAICQRIPTGAGRGNRHVKKGRALSVDEGKRILVEGASEGTCDSIGIPLSWRSNCEDASHVGHDGAGESLALRLDQLLSSGSLIHFEEKLSQIGSYGGGNHFGECEAVRIIDTDKARSAAGVFGLRDGCIGFLSHCGSRGLGYQLATGQFKSMQKAFLESGTAFPGGDRELVYAPVGSKEGNLYLDDMALGANFATMNHLLINTLVLEAFQEVLPGAEGNLVYFISHNIARREVHSGKPAWVHRKGATRAFPAEHPELAGTRFQSTGHPILLPGNPISGSVIMVAEKGANRSCFSVNHGAGRRLGRRAAMRTLAQEDVDAVLARNDILSNCRRYPIDEAPAVYKDFNEVIRSVELAGLASTVAKLDACFVIKDGDGA